MSKYRSARQLAVALGCAIAVHAGAQAPDPVPRPKVALVLSGGGARGLAHVGVLKVLREQRIPVDLIVATSMGSIVGGAYAAGRTPDQLEDFVDSADWERMFSDRPPREDLSFRRKEDDQRLIGKIELGLTREGVVLPRGAFGSQNLEEFLRHITRLAGDARTLNELQLPFRAVATDLATGEPVILKDIPLAVAMRASMSIPGAFAPTEVEGRLLGDGGLTRNLPVEIARELGAEVIIAVNVGTPLLPRSALSSALGVAQQMINILTEQNVQSSIAALGPNDILISPDLSGVSFLDFERGKDLVVIGEAAARAAVPRLSKLAVSPEKYAIWELDRTRRPTFHGQAIAEVRIEGTVRTNPEALRREVRERAGIEPGSDPTDEQLVKAARVLHGLGDFERVDVRSRVEDGRRVVVVDVDEKPWGPNYLRFGGQAVATKGESRFSVIVQHTHTWMNSWGAEWRNELTFGDASRFDTSLYQPLGPGSPWFVEGSLAAGRSDFDLFENRIHPSDRITTSNQGFLAVLGRRLGGIGVARAGVGRQWFTTRPAISSRSDLTAKDSADYAFLGANFDTLDDPNFPRRGYLVSGATARYWFDKGPSPVQAYSAEALLPFTYGRMTFLGLGSVGRSTSGQASFGLGGFFALSGTPPGAISGSHVLAGALLGYYRMGDLPRTIGRAWYAGASIEAGNAWTQRADVSLGDMRKAGSIFVGMDTIVGPFYAGWGHTFGGQSAFYLFLGRPTNRLQREF